MKIIESNLNGCYQIIPNIIEDNRGKFVKTFHKDVFNHNNLNFELAEEYYSISKQNVLRGLHFQIPPQDHYKMVYCVEGEVIDVVVDLRINSPTYQHFEMFELSAKKSNIIYIPSGFAHGFLVISQLAIMIYKVSSVYSPEHDQGILWNSVGIPWQIDYPILSQRDSNFPPLSEFESPFI